jgi:hypothetical protein
MSSSQVQLVFIIIHYLASCFYLSCQNEFRDTFLNSLVPNTSKSDFNVIYFLTNRTCVRNGLRDFSITLYLVIENMFNVPTIGFLHYLQTMHQISDNFLTKVLINGIAQFHISYSVL